MAEQIELCTSCAEHAATMRCTDPHWCHYLVCTECAAQFNHDSASPRFVPRTEPATPPQWLPAPMQRTAAGV